MKVNTIVKANLIASVALTAFCASQGAYASEPQPLTAKAGEVWKLEADRSDEFDIRDNEKWNFQPPSFAVWSWDKKNAEVADGILTLTALRDDHTRTFWDGCNKQKVDDFPLYFKSGIAQSKKRGNYGYYEARIKGADLHPGVSPAFWLYSTIDRTLENEGDVRYSEIDVVELQQDNDSVTHSDHNLHNIIYKDGKQQWMRPKKFPETNQNVNELGFDPREDFHVYAVNVTPEDITWYVDGEQVGYKKNLYWHRQMAVTLSMGMRGKQFTTWKCNQFYPVPLDNKDTGLPTTMKVDYVRVWTQQ